MSALFVWNPMKMYVLLFGAIHLVTSSCDRIVGEHFLRDDKKNRYLRAMSVSWNPWHGCLRISEGCRHCYVYRQDAAWQKDGSDVRLTSAYNLPTRRRRDGRWKVPAGESVYTCFTSDFLLAEADVWRPAAWEMIRLRRDLHFVFFTKRIDRLEECLPADWGAMGYENVTIGCTVENEADHLPVGGGR